ncbi:MAG: DUF3566 domain-containing protein [Acidimicrobiales bacterium]
MSVIDRTDRTEPLDSPDVAGDETPVGHDEKASIAATEATEATETNDTNGTNGVGSAPEIPAPGPRELRFRGPQGMRIRRIRLKSVMKIASVFFVLGYLVTMATLVVIWNVTQRLGFVADFEETMMTSLGLDTFEVVGQDLFDVAVVGFGVLFAMGLVITVLLTIVYNATCALLGGLAVETGSLRRPKRVFSLRHRRFITVR